MTAEIDLRADLQPPMANGEVLFEAPWQGRVFGMAVALHESGVFAWSEFQNQLIAVIAAVDAAEPAPEYAYYDHFARALDELLIAKGLLDAASLEARTAEFGARPHGHDH